MRSVMTLMVGASLVLMVGCDGGTRGGYDTGLPADAVVEDLSQDELQQACLSTEAYIQRIVTPEFVASTACIAEAGLIAQLSGVAACEAALDDCVAEQLALDPAEPVTLACDEITPTDVAGCSATVGEIEDCFERTGDATAMFEDLLSCDLLAGDAERLASAQQEAEEAQAAVDAACAPLQAAGCAGFSAR